MNSGIGSYKKCELRVKNGVRGLSFSSKNLNLENASLQLWAFFGRADQAKALYSRATKLKRFRGFSFF